MIFVLPIVLLIFVYAYIYRPELIAILLFTLIISNVNFDISFLPLNTRAIITLALVGRIFFDKREGLRYPSFLGTTGIKYLVFFLLYVLLVSYAEDLFSFDLVKVGFSTVFAAFCVYHFFYKNDNSDYIKIALIIAGIICFADLAFTYMSFGAFPVQRLYLIYTGQPPDVSDVNFDGAANHNFFGQVCGMCFVYLFSEWLSSKRKATAFEVSLLPVMFLGVLMSTSRSALLAMLVITLFLIIKGLYDPEQKKRVIRIGSVTVGTLAAIIMLFVTVGKSLNLESNFIEQITYRLTEEPVAMVKKSLGQSYNIQNLGSMDWREESSSNAYAAYMDLSVIEQIFGIGSGGFLLRDLGHGLNPHNGILLILIEDGLFGFCLYLIIIGSAIFQSVKIRNFSPNLAVLLFIIVYGVGQNGELTSSTTFLFLVALVAENNFLSLNKYKILPN